MIVNSNETKAVLTGNMEVTRGSISLNKETFGLIIKGIYEDKVLASCREPIFNAVDSHVESGRGDVPIIIHSPTDLEPYFFVQDVGLGMSEEMVRNTFMNLGESTKRNSNALVGNKGVGSKAPFSMVDTFDVVSVPYQHNSAKCRACRYEIVVAPEARKDGDPIEYVVDRDGNTIDILYEEA